MMAASASNGMYWVNCNKCAVGLFSDDGGDLVKMMISSCGCIVCTECITGNNSDRCTICRSRNPKQLIINKHLPQNVMEMFNQNDTSLTKINRRLQFQNEQFERTNKLLDKLLEEAEAELKQQEELERQEAPLMAELDQKIEEKRRNCARLEEELKALKLQCKKDKKHANKNDNTLCMTQAV